MLNRSFLMVVVPVMLGVAYASCKSNVKVKKVTVDSITPTATTAPAPAAGGNLSAAQLDKIMTIQRAFAEVNPSTLEETIDDFKQEKDPDREIAIWMAMANAYEKFTNTRSLDINKKTEAYNLILMRSMENEADAKAETNLKYLSDKEVAEIFSYYTLEARPLTVENR